MPGDEEEECAALLALLTALEPVAAAPSKRGETWRTVGSRVPRGARRAPAVPPGFLAR